MDDHQYKHHRQSMRLKGYDYSQPGGYFVTVCVHEHACLFGQIISGEMVYSDAGKMVARWWTEINHKFPTVEIDEFTVMPNHFHGIVVIIEPEPVGADLEDLALHQAETDSVRPGVGTHVGVPLHTVVQWFKTMTTNEYIRGVRQFGWTPFRGKLWQRNYYEHVIRDQDDLERIQRYIAHNPIGWEEDHEFNPNAR
jgi:REP element-mobilizing transposase RayT